MENNNNSNIKLSTKIMSSFVFVMIISTFSGLFLGHKLRSPISITIFIIAIILSVYTMYAFYKNIHTKLKIVAKELDETTSNLKMLSEDLTTSGHKLSEGSAEQAASIQETSSTLEEASSMVHQTTQNTKEADVLAKQTKESADKGNVEMNNMLSAMEELKKSSDEIAKIIKVIDEIAFQTNILSLNAAVEAARAGDAGKGFAVVAEEVRNLAQRSATAAKDTAGIIESNINLSEKCLQITQKVGSSLSGIKDDTHKVSELLDEISTASQEQEIGINQINQAVSQMETVLQSNAVTAQDSAISAEQLSTHSDEIENIAKTLSNVLYGSSVTNSIKIKSANKTLIPQKGPSKTISIQNTKIEPIKIKEKPKSSKDSNIINPEEVIPLDDF